MSLQKSSKEDKEKNTRAPNWMGLLKYSRVFDSFTFAGIAKINFMKTLFLTNRFWKWLSYKLVL